MMDVVGEPVCFLAATSSLWVRVSTYRYNSCRSVSCLCGIDVTDHVCGMVSSLVHGRATRWGWLISPGRGTWSTDLVERSACARLTSPSS